MLACGNSHSFVLTAEDELFAFGCNKKGQLGLGWLGNVGGELLEAARPKVPVDGESTAEKAPATHADITVQVVKARNLKSMDTGGTSDPFVVVSFGRQKKTTKTINKVS
jgi:alpha-tubulin suppressor-like RCC1 family protein